MMCGWENCVTVFNMVCPESVTITSKKVQIIFNLLTVLIFYTQNDFTFGYNPSSTTKKLIKIKLFTMKINEARKTFNRLSWWHNGVSERYNVTDLILYIATYVWCAIYWLYTEQWEHLYSQHPHCVLYTDR